MPSTSPAQAKLMSALAHGWKPVGAEAKAHMPPLSVAREFHEADKKAGVYMHYKADGGKVGALVNFAKAGTRTLMDRLEGAFHNPYTADTDQVRRDISKYWQTNAPAVATAPPAAIAKPREPSVEDLTAQLHELASKGEYAEGGPVDEPKRHVRFRARADASSGPSLDPLALIRHAADRVSAAVSDDPHHMLARIAGGLTSQLAGLTPQGKAQFGRVPGIVAETKALPAGLVDLGKGAADLGGALADAASAHGYTAPGVTAAQAIRDGLNRLQERYGGDLAPAWSRKAEADSGKMHAAVHNQMGLSAPHGFAENTSEALGMMLGQIPVMGQEEKAASMAGKLLKSPIEWLSPSVRPSLANYGVGALAGGTMGAAGDEGPPPPAMAAQGPAQKERFE